MSQYGGSLDYIDRMNNSFDQGARVQQGDFVAQRDRVQRLQDQALLENARRFDAGTGFQGQQLSEGGRQFDSRMNVLRDLFSRQGGGYAPMPNGPQQQAPQGYAMSMGGNGAQPGQPPAFDDPMRPQINNYLAQLLGRR